MTVGELAEALTLRRCEAQNAIKCLYRNGRAIGDGRDRNGATVFRVTALGRESMEKVKENKSFHTPRERSRHSNRCFLPSKARIPNIYQVMAVNANSVFDLVRILK